MIRINELKLKVEDDEANLRHAICKYLKINASELIDFKIIKRSLDARKKEQIHFSYMIDVELKNETGVLAHLKDKISIIDTKEYQLPSYGSNLLPTRPVIIGFGPCGMFAALLLAQMGLKPIVFERGERIEDRIKSVNQFWLNRNLNEESNIQFGEGGAGTFSDGKLTTRVKDERISYILKEFINSGANQDISYVHNPHIGTDILVRVVENIRNKITQLGGEVHFNAKVTDITIENNHVQSITVNHKNYPVSDLILAIGHSARDTFSLLYSKGVTMIQKALAVGFRIEHPQVIINQAQYGTKYYNHPRLEQAEYKLTHKAKNNRSVYTFCMCPGGIVVPSSSEANTVVTNGMSEHARDRENANSAIVVTINETDFPSNHPLAGMDYQREMEKKAFILGGSNYNAPVQRVEDFLNNRASTKLGSVKPSYIIGHTLANLNELYSKEITDALHEGIIELDKKLHQFALDDAILTGVETRTSSPIRIVRNENLESVNVSGLYPAGEGAGYAGGIMSSAIDGMKVAEKIINKYRI